MRFCCKMHAIGSKLIWCSILSYMHSCFHQLFMKHLNVLLILLHWKSCGNRKQGGINIGMLLQSCSQSIVLLLSWTYQIILNYILFRKHNICFIKNRSKHSSNTLIFMKQTLQLMQLSRGFYGTDYDYKFAKQNELRFP